MRAAADTNNKEKSKYRISSHIMFSLVTKEDERRRNNHISWTINTEHRTIKGVNMANI